VTAFVLIVLGGFLLGGAISLRSQPVPKVVVVLVGLAGVAATVAGALQL
jgi:hypothetical protein